MLQTAQAVAYRVGQSFPAYIPPGIFRPGRPRWHALVVFPHRERAARAWLMRSEGVSAFYPVEYSFAWHRGFRRQLERPYVPGYLFVRFPGQPRWHLLLDDERRLVRDVLRMSDGITPGELHPGTLRRIQAMANLDRELTEARHARAVLVAGNRVRFSRGPMADLPPGTEIRIVSLNTRGDRARFEITLVGGGSIPGEVGIDMLEKLED